VVQVNGASVWQYQADKRLAPASLTKLMTALVLMEDYAPAAVVEIRPEASAVTGSRLGVRSGDKFRAGELLAATLIASSNDACRALALWRGGDEARFVTRMNALAQTMGLRNTRFANACGHDAPGHYSSANDLARLAQAAMQHPAIAREVRRTHAVLRTIDGARQFTISNHNALVGRFRGAIGIKSGFTAKAGKCVIAYAVRDDTKVLLVLLNDRQRWWRAHAMLERAFEQARLEASQATSEMNSSNFPPGVLGNSSK
jgi:D-alanyl-D-alanine carboxypeptidase (penicillin-binding protein 5/6)